MVRIDVPSFLALTAVLAAGCSSSRPAPPAARAEPYDTTESSGANVVIPEPQPEEREEEPVATVAEAPDESGCSNDVGEVSCDFVDDRFSGPACEGFSGSCQLLGKGYGYKKRVAAAIARCWESRGRRACSIPVRQACIRTALQEACPDQQYRAFCEDARQRCEAQRKRADYSVDECVKTLSALEGGELDWAKSAIGSPSREGCKLMFPVY